MTCGIRVRGNTRVFYDAPEVWSILHAWQKAHPLRRSWLTPAWRLYHKAIACGLSPRRAVKLGNERVASLRARNRIKQREAYQRRKQRREEQRSATGQDPQ